jgi:hypothetical protein
MHPGHRRALERLARTIEPVGPVNDLDSCNPILAIDAQGRANFHHEDVSHERVIRAATDAEVTPQSASTSLPAFGTDRTRPHRDLAVPAPVRMVRPSLLTPLRAARQPVVRHPSRCARGLGRSA